MRSNRDLPYEWFNGKTGYDPAFAVWFSRKQEGWNGQPGDHGIGAKLSKESSGIRNLNMSGYLRVLAPQEFSIFDVDFMLYREFNRRHNLLFLEVKTGDQANTAYRAFSSKTVDNGFLGLGDIMQQIIVPAMIEYWTPERTICTKRGERPVLFHGFHVLSMAGTFPGDSGANIWWDGEPITERALEHKLLMDIK